GHSVPTSLSLNNPLCLYPLSALFPFPQITISISLYFASCRRGFSVRLKLIPIRFFKDLCYTACTRLRLASLAWGKGRPELFRLFRGHGDLHCLMPPIPDNRETVTAPEKSRLTGGVESHDRHFHRLP